MSLKDIQFIAGYVGNQSGQYSHDPFKNPINFPTYNGNLTYGPTQASTIFYQQLNTSRHFVPSTET